MLDKSDNKIIRHLRRQEWPLTAWLFGSIQLDESYFSSNRDFPTALECIEDIETITHFNHDDPFLESDDDSEELVDANYRLTIEYTRKFKRIRSPIPFIAISAGDSFLILTPVRYWSLLDGEYSRGDTNKLDFECFMHEQKLTSPRPHDEILQETWKHATKSGDRDMRYKDNFSASLVQRYGVTLLLQDGSKWEFGGLLEAEWDPLIQAFQNVINQEFVEEFDESDQNDEEYEEIEDDDENSWDDQEEEYEEEPWYEILGVSPEATHEEIKAAYREKIKQYHSDRVSGLGEKLQIVAKQESQKLNAAREEGLSSKA